VNIVINVWVPSNVGNLQLAEELLASGEGLCSVKLVNCVVNSLVKLFVFYCPICVQSGPSYSSLLCHVCM
jgi:hypothetical protein